MRSRLSANTCLEGTLAGIGDDVVLDLVDLVGVAIEDREVAVDDAVEERPQQEVGTPRQDGLDAELELVDRVRVPAARVDRQQEPLAEHDVGLRGLQLVGAREHEHDHVDDVPDELDLRPLVAADDVLGDEGMQPDVVGDRLDDLG